MGQPQDLYEAERSLTPAQRRLMRDLRPTEHEVFVAASPRRLNALQSCVALEKRGIVERDDLHMRGPRAVGSGDRVYVHLTEWGRALHAYMRDRVDALGALERAGVRLPIVSRSSIPPASDAPCPSRASVNRDPSFEAAGVTRAGATGQ